MLDSRYVIIPFVLQVLCMGIDELYFHRQRGLPRWERIGHPLDTMTVLFCMLWILFVPPSSRAVGIFVFLSLFSCFFITKDESVHHRLCRPGEHWLHAVLFVLHPVVLLCAGLLWAAVHQQSFGWLHYEGFERAFLLGNTLLIFFFGLYQLVYWNFIWKPVSVSK